ncbi:MAG: lysoplasmalogenase [Chloroflexota bacterium]
MFTALIQTPQRYWLIGLLIVWAILLFGGFIIGTGDPARRMPTWTRMASSATLVVAAYSWYLFSRGTAGSGYALLIAVGMTFGFIGDLWLAGLLPGGRNVIGGIVAFGIGHIFYIIAFLRFSNETGLDDPMKRWGSLLIWLLIGALGWYFIVFRGQEPSIVTWVALPYALLLASTAGLATGMGLQDSHFIPLAIGAALFLLSDLILAGELFAGLSFPLIGDVIWLTYGPAQMLIVYSIGYALARLARTV